MGWDSTIFVIQCIVFSSFDNKPGTPASCPARTWRRCSSCRSSPGLHKGASSRRRRTRRREGVCGRSAPSAMPTAWALALLRVGWCGGKRGRPSVRPLAHSFSILNLNPHQRTRRQERGRRAGRGRRRRSRATTRSAGASTTRAASAAGSRRCPARKRSVASSAVGL